MFANDNDAERKAKTIADWLADYDSFQSHSRRVGREQLAEKEVRVSNLELDHDLQDAVLSVYHATMHTFSGTGAVKIIENHHGQAWVLTAPQLILQPAPPPAQAAPASPNRAERRHPARGS